MIVIGCLHKLASWIDIRLSEEKEERMTKAKSSQGGLTRRGFLKTTAAVAGATAVVGSASLTALAAGEEAAE